MTEDKFFDNMVDGFFERISTPGVCKKNKTKQETPSIKHIKKGCVEYLNNQSSHPPLEYYETDEGCFIMCKPDTKREGCWILKSEHCSSEFDNILPIGCSLLYHTDL